MYKLSAAVVIASYMTDLALPPSSNHVHMDFYIAVAGILPVLLLGALVEVVAGRPVEGEWFMAVFIVSAVGGETAALVALATSHSNSGLLWASIQGIALTTMFLLFAVYMHIET